MIAVVAAVGGEVEGDGKSLLPGGKVAPVECIGILRGGEAGILADRPGLRRVHRGVGAAQKRWLAGVRVEEVEPGEILFAIDRLHRNAFGRQPRYRQSCRRTRADRRVRVSEVDLGEVGHLTHLTSRISRAACKVETTSQPT